MRRREGGQSTGQDGANRLGRLRVKDRRLQRKTAGWTRMLESRKLAWA